MPIPRIAALNPTNSAVLEMLPLFVNYTDGGLVVLWQGASNRLYSVERATNLAVQPAFTAISTNFLGSGLSIPMQRGRGLISIGCRYSGRCLVWSRYAHRFATVRIRLSHRSAMPAESSRSCATSPFTDSEARRSFSQAGAGEIISNNRRSAAAALADR